MSTARKSREKTPCEPIAKSKPTRGSSRKSSNSGHTSTTTVCTTEASSKRKAKSSSSEDKVKDHLKRAASSDAEQGSDNSALTGATAYWNEELLKKVLSRKKEVLDRFMAAITECLDRKLEPFEEPCDGEGCDPSSSRGSSKSSACKKDGSSNKQTIGKKRQFQRDDDEDGNASNGDDGQRNVNNKRSKTTPDGKRRYACPYKKYSPGRFGQVSTCCGPGWIEPHRVKEHLLRKHILPDSDCPDFACPRCCKNFLTEDLLVKHQRAAKACTIRKPMKRDLADGFDKEQAELLKKSRKGPGHERWIDWYCILFRLDPSSPALPSPYQDDPDGISWRDGHTSRSKFEPFIKVFKKRFLELVAVVISSELDKAMLGAEPTIRSNVFARIPSLANSVQRIVQTDPELLGLSGEDGDSGGVAIPPALDVSQLVDSNLNILDNFDDKSFVPGDGFDFSLVQNPGDDYQHHADGSSSYLSDNTNGFNASSNTSVEEGFYGGSKDQRYQQTAMPSQSLSLPLADPFATAYY